MMVWVLNVWLLHYTGLVKPGSVVVATAAELFLFVNLALMIVCLIVLTNTHKPLVVVLTLELGFLFINMLLLVSSAFAANPDPVTNNSGTVLMLILGIAVAEGIVGVIVLVAMSRCKYASGFYFEHFFI